MGIASIENYSDAMFPKAPRPHFPRDINYKLLIYVSVDFTTVTLTRPAVNVKLLRINDKR